MLLLKKSLAEDIQKYKLTPENLFCSSVGGTLQEKTVEFTRVFRTLIPDLSIEHSGNVFLHWLGQLRLNTLTENLLKLKSEDLRAYTYLMNNHKKEIKEVKKLIVKLKLQSLPIPSLYIDYIYNHKKQQEVTGQYIQIGGSSPYWYFFKLYKKEYKNLSLNHKQEVCKQAKQYLSSTRPVLVAVYEAIALTVYHHLQFAHKSNDT